MRVTFFQRKRRSAATNFSIESIFEDVRRRLEREIDARCVLSTFESSGAFRRVFNTLEAVFRQGDVNHVTGDINYIGILLRKSRTVQTIHDCGHVERATGLRRALLRLLWISLPVSRCAVVTVVSEATRRDLLRHVPNHAGKIVVIPVAISERFKRTDRPFAKARPRILQVGTAPNKNISRLASALNGVDCFLDVVGRLRPEDEAALRREGVSFSCSWGLSSEAIVRKYEEADIVTLASTDEGFGMPILEGQAVGRPVVTGNVLSMPEVAGDAACLVDPYDVASIRSGILKVIQDDEYRRALVARGFENAKRFDAQRIALQYREVYAKVLLDRAS
jgi:glycosyltransferase involved in cell wall biosynthesis